MEKVTKTNRTTFLRSKNRFYIAGWVAAEYNEVMQSSSLVSPKFEMEYIDYAMGYNDSMANSFVTGEY